MDNLAPSGSTRTIRRSWPGKTSLSPALVLLLACAFLWRRRFRFSPSNQPGTRSITTELAMPTGSVSNLELARLFSGDDLSAGYYDVILVRELCRRVGPLTFERLASFVFQSKPVQTIDPD